MCSEYSKSTISWTLLLRWRPGDGAYTHSCTFAAMCHLVDGTKPPMEVGGMTWDNSATATCL